MERVLPLRGGRNFRDLGGYRSADGRHVRWRRVFRSGVMNRLTDADRDYLATLEIRASCDLREAHERSLEPSDWRDWGVEQMTWIDRSGTARLAEAPRRQGADRRIL